MSKRLEDLIDAVDELEPAERARLRRVHDLLLEVGPPPAVPPGLWEPRRRQWLPARRRLIATSLAAALAAAVFGAGYLAGDRAGDRNAVRTIPMSGLGAARGASASIELLPEDDAGNWPLEMHVSGLKPNAGGRDWYELWLTKDGKAIASCGRFTVDRNRTTVQLSVPYQLRGYDGWIVTRRGSDEALLMT